MSRSKTSTDREAGPMVQTIFVLDIFELQGVGKRVLLPRHDCPGSGRGQATMTSRRSMTFVSVGPVMSKSPSD